MAGSIVISAALLAVAAGSASASAGGNHADFTAQAKSVGLTDSAAKELQSKVDSYLSETGGTQVGVNKIKLRSATLLVTLPGEKRARDLDVQPQSTNSTDSFFYGHMYGFSQPDFEGDVMDMYNCYDHRIYWSGYGSWLNNQTTGTKAKFKSDDGVIRWTSPGAESEDPHADWSWVHWVLNCG
jgi:hypothetical protein